MSENAEQSVEQTAKTVEGQAAELMAALNSLLERGADSIPGTAKFLLEQFALYNGALFFGNLVLVGLCVLGGFVAYRLMRWAAKASEAEDTSKPDQSFLQELAVWCGAISIGLGATAIVTIFFALGRLAAWMAPVGYLLSRSL